MSKKKPPQIPKYKEVSLVRSSAAEYLTFVAATGGCGVEAVYADESIWLTQKMMGVLYDVNVRTVNEHLKKIFSDSELQDEAVIRKFRITASGGKNYNTLHYKLPRHHRRGLQGQLRARGAVPKLRRPFVMVKNKRWEWIEPLLQ